MEESRSALIHALRKLVNILDRPTWAASGIDKHAADIAEAKATLRAAEVPHG